MSKSQRLTTIFLKNLKPHAKTTNSTDYEVNLSAMKDSGLPIGVRCLVGKSCGKRFLLCYTYNCPATAYSQADFTVV